MTKRKDKVQDALDENRMLLLGVLTPSPQFHPAAGGKRAMAAENSGKTDVHDKIRHALTEARVVLPGAQALLGFQLATASAAELHIARS